jgi:hypothetical protein
MDVATSINQETVDTIREKIEANQQKMVDTQEKIEATVKRR